MENTDTTMLHATPDEKVMCLSVNDKMVQNIVETSVKGTASNKEHNILQPLVKMCQNA